MPRILINFRNSPNDSLILKHRQTIFAAFLNGTPKSKQENYVFSPKQYTRTKESRQLGWNISPPKLTKEKGVLKPLEHQDQEKNRGNDPIQ